MAADKFSTYDVSNSLIRDVDKVIRNIDPTDTPFQSTIGSGKVKQKLFEWIEEALPASAFGADSNAQVEGFDAPAASQAEVSYRTNLVQTFARTAKVTGFLDDADLYGRKSEFARQKALQSKALKNDVELELVGGAARAAVVGSDSVARKFANVAQMIDGTMVNANGGSPRALTETIVLAGAQALYTAGVKADHLMVKPGDTLLISDFMKTSGAGRERDFGAAKKIVNSVEVYESPFMTFKVQKNRWMLSSTAMIYDADMWELCWYRSWKTKSLPSTGDWQADYIFGDCAPKHKHFKSSYFIKDLS